MALALSKAAPLKPEIRLSQALKDYEATLTEEQKKSFHHTSPPRSRDVMTLTFEINRQNEGRRSRIWGARLTNFLNSVKGFTAVVDTVIGSAGNPIAGAVWGAVKTAMQVASTFESYYDALSTMLMSVGQSAPRYETYALLYPASAGLRKELCNYFSVVVDICKAAVVFVRKPFISQALDALRKSFNDEFGKFQRDLVKFGDAVRDEVSLAAKQQQSLDSKEEAKERMEMSLFRRTSALFQQGTTYQLEENKKWRKLRARSRFLESCSTYNHETALNQARRKGRSSWLFEANEYKQWKQSGPSSVLLCSGIVGAGKTVLCSSVIEELIITRAGDASVSYFFCRDDDLESLKARAIMGSLARQLLSGISAILFDKVNQDIGPMTLDIEQVSSHLLALLPPTGQYIIVLDGLDECESEEVQNLFETLRRLLKSSIHNFKLFWTGRSNFVARVDKWFPSNFHVSISRSKNGAEISDFIELALDEALEFGKLQLRDPNIIVKIQDALENGACEMFLWVAFQINSICRENTDERILTALEDLPKDMPTTYRRILRRLRDSGSTDPFLGKKIFEIVSAARRPLSLEELREAISIEPGNTTWDDSKLVNDVMKSLDCCGSLIVVDEELSTVHFAHSSVKQYLETSPYELDIPEYHINPHDANLVLGEIIVTYLHLDILQKQLTGRSNASKTLSTQDMPLLLGSGFPLSTVASSNLARRLLKNRKTAQFDVGRELERVASLARAPNTSSLPTHALLSYAQEHWLPHTVYFTPGNIHDPVKRLYTEIIENGILTLELPWTSEDARTLNVKFLDLVAQSKNPALVLYALQRLTGKVKELARQMQTLLEFLPSHPSSPEIFDTSSDWGKDICSHALLCAVCEDNEALVRLLLDKTPADVNIAAGTYRNLLELAIKNIDLDILEILLEHGADPNARAIGDRSMLETAASFSIHERAIQLLLAKGAERVPIDETLSEKARNRLRKAYDDYDKKIQQENEGVGL